MITLKRKGLIPLLRGSLVRMKSRGEIGFPCTSPLVELKKSKELPTKEERIKIMRYAISNEINPHFKETKGP